MDSSAANRFACMLDGGGLVWTPKRRELDSWFSRGKYNNGSKWDDKHTCLPWSLNQEKMCPSYENGGSMFCLSLVVRMPQCLFNLTSPHHEIF